jgi:branched-chain amino acid transport system permease protein
MTDPGPQTSGNEAAVRPGPGDPPGDPGEEHARTRPRKINPGSGLRGRQVPGRRAAVIALLLALAAIAPLPFGPTADYVCSGIAIQVLFAVSVGFPVGFAGVAALGNQLFYGVGGYVCAWLVVQLGVSSPLVDLAAGSAAGMVAAGLVGILIRRGVGLNFGLVALGVGQLVYLFVYQSNYVYSSNGIVGVVPGSLFGLDISSGYAQYGFTAAIVAICIGGVSLIRATVLGRAIRAARDSRPRAAGLGIPVDRYYWIAFVIGGLLGAVAGCLQALQVGSATPDMLYWSTGAIPLLAALLGGISTASGPVIGGIIYGTANYWLSENTQFANFYLGGAVVLLFIIAPDGLVGVSRTALRSLMNRPSWRFPALSAARAAGPADDDDVTGSAYRDNRARSEDEGR